MDRSVKKTNRLKSRISPKKHPKPSFIRFMGVSLGGGKSDRTVLTILDYYKSHKKLVISRVLDRLSSEGEVSADLKLYETLHEYRHHLKQIAFDVPLSLPKCFRCELTCPGYEACDEEEILWLWKQHRQNKRKNKNHRLFTPYTRRCAEELWAKELEGAWSLNDALGSNHAPLLARGRFLARRLKPHWKSKLIEVIPRLSLIRWSHQQKLMKSMVFETRKTFQGMTAREYVLKNLVKELDLFIYDQDKTFFIDSLVAFDSLWAALTAFWVFQKKSEARPKSFPKNEGWIEVPRF